ncbi:MAG: hypothetical protein KC535_00470 [Nanoarchaeota archaeon]|nr:hypothetical protein [Nanoarchaeota archaeon]
MVEPELFPNQPDPKEHVARHKNEGTKEDAKEMALAGSQLNNVATRLKILEERYGTLRKKSQTTEHNIVEVEKNHYDDLRIINDDIAEIKLKMRDIFEKVSMLSDEIENFASRNELKVIQKYVEYWQPVDFVTRKEVNDFLRKRFHQKDQGKEVHEQHHE